MFLSLGGFLLNWLLTQEQKSEMEHRCMRILFDGTIPYFKTKAMRWDLNFAFKWAKLEDLFVI